MKKFLAFLCLVMMLPCFACAEEQAFVLSATVAAEESALLALPYDGAEIVLALEKDAALIVTELGSVYCKALADETEGYIALKDLAFDVLEGRETQIAEAVVSHLTGYMSLRKEPSVRAEALYQMARGRLMLVLGEENDMYYVAFPGYIGYAAKKNIRVQTKEPKCEFGYVDNDAAVRLRMDMQYDNRYIVTNIEAGTPLQVIKNTVGWAHVEVAGHRGYMVAKYLHIGLPENAAP